MEIPSSEEIINEYNRSIEEFTRQINYLRSIGESQAIKVITLKLRKVIEQKRMFLRTL